MGEIMKRFIVVFCFIFISSPSFSDEAKLETVPLSLYKDTIGALKEQRNAAMDREAMEQIKNADLNRQLSAALARLQNQSSKNSAPLKNFDK